MRLGGKRTIQHNDIFEVPRNYQADVLWNRFEPIWKEEVKSPK